MVQNSQKSSFLPDSKMSRKTPEVLIFNDFRGFLMCRGCAAVWWRQQNSNLRPDPLETVYRRTGQKTNKPEPFGSCLFQCGRDNRTRNSYFKNRFYLEPQWIDVNQFSHFHQVFHHSRPGALCCYAEWHYPGAYKYWLLFGYLHGPSALLRC